MENLNKKQKVLMYGIIIVLIVLIIIYLFTKDNTIYSNYENLCLPSNTTNKIEENLENTIYIHVTGEVEKPSVVKLKDGARIIDAIEEAGGLTDSAEIEYMNLAYKLKDGEQIYIPSLDEVLKCKEENKMISYISSEIENEKTYNKSQDIISESVLETKNELVNINTATQTELETLNGIGPSTAKSIIDYRKENGKFTSIEDIINVTGIGEAKFNGIKEEICV